MHNKLYPLYNFKTVIDIFMKLGTIIKLYWTMDIGHVTNEEVRRKIQAAIGEYDELLTLVKKRKLRWFGHVSRSSGLAKTILQGTVKGKRKRGRQKKSWEDNIKEWTGMDFASSTRAAENRSRWKGLLRIHLWCPDDLPRLWDRIE